MSKKRTCSLLKYIIQIIHYGHNFFPWRSYEGHFAGARNFFLYLLEHYMQKPGIHNSNNIILKCMVDSHLPPWRETLWHCGGAGRMPSWGYQQLSGGSNRHDGNLFMTRSKGWFVRGEDFYWFLFESTRRNSVYDSFSDVGENRVYFASKIQ